MTNRVVSRRELLREIGIGAGVTWAATAGVGAAPASADVAEETTGGIVERIEAPGTAWLRDPEDRSISVTFSDGATFWRARPTTIDAFVPGDEVTVEGEWTGDTSFSGTHMVSTFRVVEGRVRGRSDDRLETDGGPITLTGDTTARSGRDMHAKPPRDIGPGDYVLALGRIEPASGEFVAVEIGVRTDG